MSYGELPLAGFLEALSSHEPAPGGGSAAALAAAVAASLCAMAGRFATGTPAGDAAAVERAEQLRDRALSLSLADAEAYGQVLSARRSTTDKELRRRRVADALSMAADVPLEVAEIAWEAAAMATKLAASGNPNLRGDSLTAAALAEAAVRAAAELVRINLGDSNDPRTRRAAELEGEASALTRAAFARQ